LHSVKSFIRTIGIDPDSTFSIREYGGPTKQALTFTRDKKTEVSTMLNFISGGYLQSQPFYTTTPSNVPGWPFQGQNASYSKNLTSGSFTYEGTYKLPVTFAIGTSQSLVRLVTSSSITSGLDLSEYTMMNVVATKGGNVSL